MKYEDATRIINRLLMNSRSPTYQAVYSYLRLSGYKGSLNRFPKYLRERGFSVIGGRVYKIGVVEEKVPACWFCKLKEWWNE